MHTTELLAKLDDAATTMNKTTPTGVPIQKCATCERTHPVTRKHCPTCGQAHLFHCNRKETR